MSFANLPTGEIKDYPPYLDRPKNINPQTNADRIRAMSDEELAEWLEFFVVATLDCNGIEHDDFEEGEHDKLLRMLQQPAEEVHNE